MILRAYEWDRLSFTNENKRRKTMQIMEIKKEQLDEIRRNTRQRVQNIISSLGSV